MQKEEIKITVADSTKEVTIRHGEAAPIELPNFLSLSGDIFSPGNFSDGRKELFDAKKAHVLVNAKDFSITLVIDEQSRRGYKVEGKLSLNQHLKELKVNKQDSFGLKELQQVLKFRRSLFTNIMEYSSIMTALQNFQAKSQTEVKAADDRRGNVNNSFNRTSQLNAPLDFSLSLPIFDNTEVKSFRVEILTDVRDAGVSFYLESIELADLIETTRQEIFALELERLSDYVIISE